MEGFCAAGGGSGSEGAAGGAVRVGSGISSRRGILAAGVAAERSRESESEG